MLMNMSEEIWIQHTLHRHSHWCHSQWVIWYYWRCRKHRPQLALSHRRKTCRIETTHWQYHRGSSNHGPTFGTAYVLIALEDLRCSKSGGSIPGRRLVRYCFIALPLCCETAQYHNVQKKIKQIMYLLYGYEFGYTTMMLSADSGMPVPPIPPTVR